MISVHYKKKTDRERRMAGEAAREYQKLVEDIHRAPRDELHQRLMQREDSVLELVRRVADQKEKDSVAPSPSAHRRQAWAFFMEFLKTWTHIYHDVMLLSVNGVTVAGVAGIFLHPERQLYVGVMVVLLALFLFFVDISS